MPGWANESFYDRLGPEFSILSFGLPYDAFVEAAARRHVPSSGG